MITNFGPVDARYGGSRTRLDVERDTNGEAGRRNETHVERLCTGKNTSIFGSFDDNLQVRVSTTSEWGLGHLNPNILSRKRAERYNELVTFHTETPVETRTKRPNTLLHACEL